MKFIFKSTILLFGFASWISIAFSQSPIIDKLFDLSDVIIQGKIMRMECLIGEVGVSECEYTMSIDSIYKGKPDTYSEFLLEFTQGQMAEKIDLDQKIDVLTFQRSCPYFLGTRIPPLPYTKDNCYETGSNLILFLQPSSGYMIRGTNSTDTLRTYELVDQWAGALTANSYLSMYIRGLTAGK